MGTFTFSIKYDVAPTAITTTVDIPDADLDRFSNYYNTSYFPLGVMTDPGKPPVFDEAGTEIDPGVPPTYRPATPLEISEAASNAVLFVLFQNIVNWERNLAAEDARGKVAGITVSNFKSEYK